MNTNLNLKRIVSLIFFVHIFILGIAQPKKQEKIEEFFWGASDKYKTLDEIPSEWNNESAIILINHNNHFYNKYKKKLNNYFLNRKVVKLNDQSAVEKFSEFNYPASSNSFYSGNETIMGVRVIKPDGTIKVIDVEKERIVETDTKEKQFLVYGFKFRTKKNYDKSYKLAIPNLEIGDIIDFYFHTYEKYRTFGTHVMDPVESILNSEYNTLDFSLSIHVENDFYVNFQSLNGAPKLKDVTPEKSRDKIYKISEKNIEKYTSKKWLYPFVEYPCTKYQISFVQNNSDYDNVYAYLSKDENKVKGSVSEEDILKFNKRFDFRSPNSDSAKKLNKHLKAINAKSYTNKKKLAEDFYYYLRSKFRTKFLEAAQAYKNNLYGTNGVYNTSYLGYNYFSDYKFLELYGFFLKKYDIPFSLIYATPRFNGGIQSLIIKEHTYRFLKFDIDGEVFFATNFDNHTFFNMIPYAIEGSDAYELAIDQKKYKISDVQTYKLPKSTYLENISNTKLDITLDGELKDIQVKSISEYKGNNKISQMEDNLYYYDYSDADLKKYNVPSLVESLSKKAKTKYNQNFSSFKTRINEERNKTLKKNLVENILCEIDNYTSNFKNLGRYEPKDPFIAEESFSITDNFIKKAGPNYIVEIGKLIGKQVEISDSEKDRKENVYMSYPRSFENEISIDIPMGYTYSGIDELNINEENSTGGFKSTAIIEGDKLVIKTLKYYSNNYELNSEL